MRLLFVAHAKQRASLVTVRVKVSVADVIISPVSGAGPCTGRIEVLRTCIIKR